MYKLSKQTLDLHIIINENNFKLNKMKATTNQQPNIIYKGIEISVLENGFYIFYLNGTEFINTNLHFAKVMLNRNINKSKKS